MEFLSYITDNALILIPALVIIGMIIKNTNLIPDKFIPVILLVVGIAGTIGIMGVTVDAVIQGVLVAGAAVFGDQIVKQLRKSE